MTRGELSQALDQMGKSQRWLAAQLQVSNTSVSRWIKGAEPIPENRREQIAALVNGNGRTHG